MTTEQHVPVDRLAAYAAGDLDATAALEVEAHVLLCADCRSDVEAVQRVTGELAAVPPVTMPDAVVARIDAALAAEAETPLGPAGDVLPMVPKKQRPSFAGFAAVAAGLALVAALGVPLLSNRPNGADRAATEAGGAGSGQVTTRRLESGLAYDAEAPEKALAEALGGARDAQFVQGTAAADSGAGAESTTVPRAGAPAPLAAKVEQLDPLRSDGARLAACVAALAESQPENLGRTALLVDFGTFEGRPALIVVFPTVRQGAIRPDRVDFWAVGPRCGVTAGDDDVLHFARIARPAGL